MSFLFLQLKEALLFSIGPASAHSAMQRGAFIALAGFVLVAVLANPDRYPNNTLLETLYASASIQTGNLYKVVLTVACDPK